MTTFKSRPVVCKITRDEIDRKPVTEIGVDRDWTKHPDFPERNDLWILRLEASDICPHRPELEKYPEDLEKELNKFRNNILSDRVRSTKFHKLTKNDLKSREMETVYDIKILQKENRYDMQVSKALKLKKFHRLPSGKFFLKIDGFKDNGYGY